MIFYQHIALVVDGGGSNGSGHSHIVNDGSNRSCNAVNVTITVINKRNINTQ